MLDELMELLERKAGSASLTIQRPRRGDWQAILFRDHPSEDPAKAIYLSYHGDTLADAVAELLADPVATAGT